ncbi:MAG: nucleotidyltransferase domain-containing protein [Candidatus Thorarchaeota archaeon]|nr:MAG: nucleotidyltransferase domain-containing protein [Candidatus Thorarchaeota archaeon]
MIDLHGRFDRVMRETVKEWKKNDNVVGVVVYGSFVTGSLTASSDLDMCVIWDSSEAPVQLMAEQDGVLLDMSFATVSAVEDVIEGAPDDAFLIAEIIAKFRNARVVHDTDNKLKKWQSVAADYVWSDNVIDIIKEKAEAELSNASELVEKDDIVGAIHELRSALFNIARAVLMKNNVFSIIKPAEVLSEVRMLDPMTYRLFLRLFKLKALQEAELLTALDSIRHWLKIAEERLGEVAPGAGLAPTAVRLAEAQRHYYGAMRLTIDSEYELAVLEMRQTLSLLGRTLAETAGHRPSSDASAMSYIKQQEPEFYEKVLVEHGAFDLLPKAVKRGIGEARFIAQRV